MQTIRERTAELQRYRDAFAGLWIEPDGRGSPTLWRSNGDRYPIFLLRRPTEPTPRQRFWDALASVLPTEAPDA